MQSPIALSLEDAEQTNSGAATLTFQYGGRRPACVRDSGHGTMQVHFVGSQAPLLLVGSQQFQMQQFHFHAPSEHSLDGTRSAMEVHMVHRDTYSGQLLVVATLVRDRKAAQPNPALAAALQYVPRRKDGAGNDSSRESVDIPDGVDASWLLPKLHGVYMYSGSLTTPPCAESVMWCVHDATIEVPPQQVLAFSKQFGSNARPLQARNGRRLTYRLI
jgi:carbonic anhydrase